MFNEKEYFVCYSTNLFRYLKMDKGINYIVCGLHEKSFQKFWLFKRNDALTNGLSEYKERGKELGVVGE